MVLLVLLVQLRQSPRPSRDAGSYTAEKATAASHKRTSPFCFVHLPLWIASLSRVCTALQKLDQRCLAFERSLMACSQLGVRAALHGARPASGILPARVRACVRASREFRVENHSLPHDRSRKRQPGLRSRRRTTRRCPATAATAARGRARLRHRNLQQSGEFSEFAPRSRRLKRRCSHRRLA